MTKSAENSHEYSKGSLIRRYRETSLFPSRIILKVLACFHVSIYNYGVSDFGTSTVLREEFDHRKILI